MADTITVKAPQVTRRVILWEKHPTHPSGEVFVVADGKAYEVAKTKRVKELLTLGQLVEVEGTKTAAKKGDAKAKPTDDAKAKDDAGDQGNQPPAA